MVLLQDEVMVGAQPHSHTTHTTAQHFAVACRMPA